MKARNFYMEKEFKNRVTLCVKHKSFSKPTEDDTKKIQTKRNSVVSDVTASYLAAMLVNGHSIHAAVCNMKTDGKSDATLRTFRKPSFLYQNVFCLDIDHGNFSQKEILERSLIKPSIIYHSFSSCSEAKRWRVVYFANKTMSDYSQVEEVNRLLLTPFLENLEDYHAENADLKASDATRVFYSGKSEELYVNETPSFNPYDLLNDLNLKERYENARDKLQPLKEFKKTRDRLVKKAKDKKLITEDEYKLFCDLKENKIATLERYNELNDWASRCEELIQLKLEDEKQQRNQVKKDKINIESLDIDVSTGEILDPVSFESLEEVKNTVIFNLSKFNPDNKIKEMTYDEANRFLANLPLDVLLGVKLGQNFKCIFHVDNSPSAGVFVGRNGMTIYKCQSDNCGLSLNTHSFLMLLMSLTSNNLRINNIQELLKVLKIRLIKNEFEIYSKIQLNDSSSYISVLPDNDPLKKRLKKDNLHELYYALIRYANTLVTDEPLKKVGEEVVIHASLSELYAFMRNDKVRGTSDFKRFVKKIKLLGIIGMFVPVPHRELKSSYYSQAIKCKEKDNYKLKSFYQFPVIDVFSHDTVYEKLKAYDESGAKLNNLTAVQVSIIFGVEEAKSNYVQNKHAGKLTAKQEKLLEQMIQNAKKLCDDQGFFTHQQLMRKVDVKCKLYPTATERFNASKNLMILTKNMLKLNEISVNRNTRKTYNIPQTFKSRDKVYFR